MRILKGDILSAVAPEKLETIKNGYLVADDAGVIQFVGAQLPQQYAGCYVEDWSGHLILQSFADMHLHAPQYAMSGMGMDMQLLDWLKTYAFKNEAHFVDLGFARDQYRRLAADLVQNGTTRVCMFSSLHVEATLILMEELERAGVCGYVGKVNMDRNGGENLEETTEGSKRDTLRWLEACENFSRIKPILTPRFTPSCTDELMAFLGNLAGERGLYVQSHLSENKGEIEWVKELCPGCSQYWESYQKFGLWKDHTVMAHCVHSDDRERQAMKEANVLVAHCPDSNVCLCSGIAPVKQMLREGLWVALGSDIAGGAMLNMGKVMVSAIEASKYLYMQNGYEGGFLSAEEAYYLGTSAGHRYFGDAPGFQPGNPLHALVVDDSALVTPTRALTLPERLERYLYRGDDRQIAAVYAADQRIR